MSFRYHFIRTGCGIEDSIRHTKSVAIYVEKQDVNYCLLPVYAYAALLHRLRFHGKNGNRIFVMLLSVRRILLENRSLSWMMS